jgi:hypothetical protein
MAAFAILLAPLLLVACATSDGVDVAQPITGTPYPVATTGGGPANEATRSGAGTGIMTEPTLTKPTLTEPVAMQANVEETRRKYERLLRAPWATDFSRTSIDFGDIMTGGPPKDGIPAIDSPEFEAVVDGDIWLDDAEPVQVVDINGDVRAYPVQVMIWHELVNDTVGGEPVVITF